MDYWKEALACAADESDVTLTEEQLAAMARVLEGAHDTFGQVTGREIADRNWRTNEDRRLVTQGTETALQHVESCVARINQGPSRLFDVMSDDQRLAMHELFETRRFIARPAAAGGR